MTFKEENQKLIKLFSPCRVTDVSDGMDWMGYHHYGRVHPSIRPLYKARAVGIARTVRYIPYEGPAPLERGDDYTEWVSMYYREIGFAPWHKDVEPGDFICLDISGVDVGLVGSNNSLVDYKNGAVGFLTNGGGIRDTDEVISQGGIPVWSKFISQGMNQCRIRCVDKDVPIGIGGVAIFPGDVVVADNDGVIVVPRNAAYQVAKYAWQEMNSDKIGRQSLYKELGWDLDDTVVPIKNIEYK